MPPFSLDQSKAPRRNRAPPTLFPASTNGRSTQASLDTSARLVPSSGCASRNSARKVPADVTDAHAGAGLGERVGNGAADAGGARGHRRARAGGNRARGRSIHLAKLRIGVGARVASRGRERGRLKGSRGWHGGRSLRRLEKNGLAALPDCYSIAGHRSNVPPSSGKCSIPSGQATPSILSIGDVRVSIRGEIRSEAPAWVFCPSPASRCIFARLYADMTGWRRTAGSAVVMDRPSGR